MSKFVFLVLAALPLASPAAAGIADVIDGTYWGETDSALLQHFDGRATLLPTPIDFGDSYARIVLRSVPVGGVPLIAFFQMDKATGRLKRIQLERQRHGITPAAFRGVLAGLEATYGAPDRMCGVAPRPTTGYQAAAERIWLRHDVAIRAIFRDTTIEAFEGCLLSDPDFGSPPCGLTGQLLVRISPPDSEGASCGLSRRVP